MQDSNILANQLDMSRNVHDMQGIDKLRRAAQSGDKGALTEAANQFEALFVQMMLKSMRKAQDALADKDSPFNSQQVKFYRDMHDQQMAVDLASKGSMGIAKLIIQQLSPGEQGFMPASAIRNNANLEDMRPLSTQQAISSREPRTDTSLSKESAATKRSAFSSPGEFIKALLPEVEIFAKQLGLEPKALLAQAAVETGWGKYMIHTGQGQNSHNLFGIKADKNWHGDSAAIGTLEFDQGVAKPQKAAFRAYNSFTDAIKDYVSFVEDNPRYQQAVKSAADPKAYFSELQQAGYATDPDYAKKVMSVLDGEIFKSAFSFIGARREN